MSVHNPIYAADCDDDGTGYYAMSALRNVVLYAPKSGGGSHGLTLKTSPVGQKAKRAVKSGKPAETGGIRGRVFLDPTGQGTDRGNPYIESSVTIKLYLAATRSLVAITASDACGDFSFEHLAAGEYFLQLPLLPEGMVFSEVVGKGAQDNKFYAADLNRSVVMTVRPGAASTCNAGLMRKHGSATLEGVIEGQVFMDLDGSGAYVDDAYTAAPVVVELYNIFTGHRAAIAEASAVDGSFQFDMLPSGSYYLSIPSPPEGCTLSPVVSDDAAGNKFDARSAASGTVVILGEDMHTRNVGFVPDADVPALYGTVFCDVHGTGLREKGDPVIQNASVELLDENGAVAAISNTNAAGQYQFSGMSDGNYTVRIHSNGSWAISGTRCEGGNRFGADGQTEPVQIEAGCRVRQDAGLVPLESGNRGYMRVVQGRESLDFRTGQN